MYTKRLFYTILILTSTFQLSFGQKFGLGVKGGLNRTYADGKNFNAKGRFGFQIGGVLSYDFNKFLGVQVEPSYAVTRVNANSNSTQEPYGISKGNKSLQYFNIPIMLKVNLFRNTALLGGFDINSLNNEEDHLLFNKEYAFKKQPRHGYTFGIDIHKFYFRYRHISRFTNVINDQRAGLEQFQVGFRYMFL